MRLLWPLLRRKPSEAQQLFSRIYSGNEWLQGSGEGSLPELTEDYRAFLSRFLREHEVRSVVDVGCGDWQFSRLMDWSGIEYLGIDAVSSVIEDNTRQFAKPGVRFQCQDVLDKPPPAADLLLLKDVLQHWPFTSISQVIPWLSQYRYVLITNDDVTGENIDISMGGYRPLDVRKAPFELPCTEVLRFASLSNRVPCTKVTLLYKNESSRRSHAV